MIKEQREKYHNDYTNEEEERVVYTAFDVTTEELVEFSGSTVLDTQSINDNIAQTILFTTSKKTGKQYWSFFEWDSAPQFQPSPQPQEEAKGQEREGEE